MDSNCRSLPSDRNEPVRGALNQNLTQQFQDAGFTEMQSQLAMDLAGSDLPFISDTGSGLEALKLKCGRRMSMSSETYLP